MILLGEDSQTAYLCMYIGTSGLIDDPLIDIAHPERSGEIKRAA